MENDEWAAAAAVGHARPQPTPSEFKSHCPLAGPQVDSVPPLQNDSTNIRDILLGTWPSFTQKKSFAMEHTSASRRLLGE